MPRSLFGYRRADVDAELERVQAQLARMAEALERGWEARRGLTAEVAALRTTLSHERAQTMSAELAGRATAARVIAEAEDQARRLHEASALRFRDANARVQQLLQAREQLLSDLRELLQTHADVLARAEQQRRPAGLAVTA